MWKLSDSLREAGHFGPTTAATVICSVYSGRRQTAKSTQSNVFCTCCPHFSGRISTSTINQTDYVTTRSCAAMLSQLACSSSHTPASSIK